MPFTATETIADSIPRVYALWKKKELAALPGPRPWGFGESYDRLRAGLFDAGLISDEEYDQEPIRHLAWPHECSAMLGEMFGGSVEVQS